jgi:hypothetical protein
MLTFYWTPADRLLKFITELGKRPHIKSATVSTIRSQAAKHTVLQRRQRNNPSRRSHLPIFLKAPSIPNDGRVSPLTILGAGRVDPFDCLPIKSQTYIYKLLDYCKF